MMNQMKKPSLRPLLFCCWQAFCLPPRLRRRQNTILKTVMSASARATAPAGARGISSPAPAIADGTGKRNKIDISGGTHTVLCGTAQ